MRQGPLADANVRRYCNQKRDEIGPSLSNNPLATRSGSRLLRRKLAQQYFGRETVSQRELSVIIRKALSSLNDAVEDEEEMEEEEMEEEETLEEIASTPFPPDDLFDAVETPLPPDDLFDAVETPLPKESRRERDSSPSRMVRVQMDASPRRSSRISMRVPKEDLVRMYRSIYREKLGRDPVISEELMSSELVEGIRRLGSIERDEE
eukprot:scaffold33911_cov32-Tisochrysis_lutea.AAC.2